MKKNNISLLICPNCGSKELLAGPYDFNDTEIFEGRLICAACNIWYRIENGILDFLPLNLRRIELYRKFSEKYKIVSELKEVNIDIQAGKALQINFFRKNRDDYEKNVVNSTYYRALDTLTFVYWVTKNLKAGDIVLDLGCGSGKQCLQFAKHGIRAIGLDISEEMLLSAKRKIDNCGLGEYIDLIIADAETPPFINGIFNACVFYGTLHHIAHKHIAIARASEKLANNGLFYSLDPNDSPVRFIFDFMMRIWRLYYDEASNSPLLSKKQLSKWLADASIEHRVRYSTYLPPHLLYLLSMAANVKLLKFSDYVFNRIPVIRTFGGAIIAEGIKTNK